MIVFLSFPNREERYRKVAKILSERGLTVRTNFDKTNQDSPEQRTDLRLARIRNSDAYVYFAPASDPQDWSPTRQVEFGYALGQEVPVSFVGRSVSSLHRFGDVFRDVNDFLEWFYSDSYRDFARSCLAKYTGKAEVA